MYIILSVIQIVYVFIVIFSVIISVHHQFELKYFEQIFISNFNFCC